jgi:hypothetical protein
MREATVLAVAASQTRSSPLSDQHLRRALDIDKNRMAKYVVLTDPSDGSASSSRLNDAVCRADAGRDAVDRAQRGRRRSRPRRQHPWVVSNGSTASLLAGTDATQRARPGQPEPSRLAGQVSAPGSGGNSRRLHLQHQASRWSGRHGSQRDEAALHAWSLRSRHHQTAAPLRLQVFRNQGSRSSLPLVRRASRSACADAASSRR